MFSRHVSRRLAQYHDGQLTEASATAVETHLAGCAPCRAELDALRLVSAVVRDLPLAQPPASVWSAIDETLTRPARPVRVLLPRMAMAAAIVLGLLAGALALWRYSHPTIAGPWEVAILDGREEPKRLPAGEWVDTGGASRARITVGDIGTVDMDPGTRVRLGHVLPDEYRLALTRGTIHARIAAPPRMFIVETPASTVVDLGCAYTVGIDDRGTGGLRVTEGWAALEWQGRESFVPAGAHCRIEGGRGPGTPSFDDASPALREALAAFDFAGGGSAALFTILAESRIRDTLTLWHLMSRVDPEDRPHVYDRIVALVPVASGVSRDKALALDADTLKNWRDELAWKW